MKRKFLAEVQELVLGGLPDARLERPNPLWVKIRGSLPTLAEVEDRFEQALETIPYPYDDSKQTRTTYDVLVRRNLLESVLAPEVLGKLFTERKGETLLHGLVDLRKPPKQGYGLRFHEDMIKLMMLHMQDIKALLSKANVPEEWAKEPLTGSLTQVAKDLQLLHPYYPDTDFPPSSTGPSIVAELAVDVHRVFARVLNRRRARGARVMAEHLTAIFCTRPDQLLAGKLKPTPDAIRKLLARHSKRKKVRTIPTN